MTFLQPPLTEEVEEKSISLRLLDRGLGVEGPRGILGDVDTKEVKAGNTFNLCPLDMNGGGVDHRRSFHGPQ